MIRSTIQKGMSFASRPRMRGSKMSYEPSKNIGSGFCNFLKFPTYNFVITSRLQYLIFHHFGHFTRFLRTEKLSIIYISTNPKPDITFICYFFTLKLKTFKVFSSKYIVIIFIKFGTYSVGWAH